MASIFERNDLLRGIPKAKSGSARTIPVRMALSPGLAVFTMSPSTSMSKNRGSWPGGSSSGSSCTLRIWLSMKVLSFWSSSKFLVSSHPSHLAGFLMLGPSWITLVVCPSGQTKAASTRSGRSSDVRTSMPANAIILSR